jgi:hypothetical protein
MFSFQSLIAELEGRGDCIEALELAQTAWLYPIQVDVSADTIINYVIPKHVAPISVYSVEEMRLMLTDDRKVFPVKQHPGAKSRVNVFFRDVFCKSSTYDLLYHKRARVIFIQHTRHLNMTNDVATGLFIWLYAAVHHFSDEQCARIVSNFNDEALLKRLSTVTKTSGIGNDNRKAVLCELTTLYGRAVGAVDWAKEDKFRTDLDTFLSEKAAVFDDAVLRAAVDEVMREECGTVHFDGLDNYWSKRWLFTKAGSHQRRIEREVFGHTITGKQATRREFAESVQDNVLLQSPPMALAGKSEKLEHGKSRALYGCDTINYYHFDYILRPVERVWRNKHALLQANAGDNMKLYTKLSSSDDTYHIMADYDDYNSQHTTRAKQIVFESLRDHCAPGEDASAVFQWAIDSLANEYIDVDGTMVKTVGTLLSGHRATTFINTILNRAYIKIILRGVEVESYHSGDDVYMSANRSDIVQEVAERLRNSVVRMNPMKQAFGSISGEFLRASFTKTGAIGYLARAVSSCVSGNWTVEQELGSDEYIQTILSHIWTITMRAGVMMGPCLQQTVYRRLPLLTFYVPSIVMLRCSVNYSPVYNRHNLINAVLVRFTTKVKMRRNDRSRLSFATDCYLSKHVNLELLKLANLTPGDVKGLMLEASYTEPAAESRKVDGVDQYCAHVNHMRRASSIKALKGELSTIVPLSYFKSRLSRQQLVSILRALGIEEGRDAYVTAWGKTANHVSTMTPLSYSSMRAYARGVDVATEVTSAYTMAV